MKKLNLLLFSTVLLFLYSNTKAQWVQVNTNFTQRVLSLTVSGTNVYAGTNGDGLFLSTDDGASWTGVNNGLPTNAIYSLATIGNTVFAGTGGSGGDGVFKSTDDGSTWTAANNGIKSKSILTLATSGSNILGGSDGVFMSTDNGANWNGVNNGIPAPTVTVLSLAANGSNLFAGTLKNGIYLSTDNGSNWTSVNNGFKSTLAIYALAANGSNVFAGTDKGAYITTDNGANWTEINTGFSSFNALHSFAFSGNNIFAGLTDGVYLTTDNGNNWTAINNGLPSFPQVFSLAVIGSNIVAGTDKGIFIRPLSDIVTDVKEISNNIPGNFDLAQNYPNPFNPSTVIRFSIPKKALVSLKIYDVLGKQVANLVNEELSAGTYNYDYDASKLTSGIYFYKIVAGSFIETKKMILMK